MSIFRKVAAGGLTALALAAGTVALTTPAAAQWRGGYGYGGGYYGGGYGWRGGYGYPLAAGVATGLAVGAIAGGPYGPGGCYLQRQPAYGPYGEFLGYRRVRVCY